MCGCHGGISLTDQHLQENKTNNETHIYEERKRLRKQSSMKCIVIAVPLMAVIWMMLVVIIIAPAQIASRISREEETEEILRLCAKVSKTEDSS